MEHIETTRRPPQGETQAPARHRESPYRGGKGSSPEPYVFFSCCSFSYACLYIFYAFSMHVHVLLCILCISYAVHGSGAAAPATFSRITCISCMVHLFRPHVCLARQRRGIPRGASLMFHGAAHRVCYAYTLTRCTPVRDKGQGHHVGQ